MKSRAGGGGREGLREGLREHEFPPTSHSDSESDKVDLASAPPPATGLLQSGPSELILAHASTTDATSVRVGGVSGWPYRKGNGGGGKNGPCAGEWGGNEGGLWAAASSASRMWST